MYILLLMIIINRLNVLGSIQTGIYLFLIDFFALFPLSPSKEKEVVVHSNGILKRGLTEIPLLSMHNGIATDIRNNINTHQQGSFNLIKKKLFMKLKLSTSKGI